MASKKPVLFLGVLPKEKDIVLEALEASRVLLDSVAFVSAPGDTKEPLRMLNAAIKKVSAGK
ncbi:MAG: hypothetical protein V4621_07685 [Pseudomonadota bacterium]